VEDVKKKKKKKPEVAFVVVVMGFVQGMHVWQTAFSLLIVVVFMVTEILYLFPDLRKFLAVLCDDDDIQMNQ